MAFKRIPWKLAKFLAFRFRDGLQTIVMILLTLACLQSPSSVEAEMCTLDVVPAATLLLPYFEVDLDDPVGTTTLFTLHNASPDAALVHSIFWTDLAAPTIDFDIYLTGYDVVTVNMRDLFDGNLAITADDFNDPSDSISPHGRHPEWDAGFPNCAGILPFTNPAVRATAFDRLSNGHTGSPVVSLSNRCLGMSHPLGNLARGYVTFDNVSECSLVLDPNDFGYFREGGTGIVNNKNQLWGEFMMIDAGSSTAIGQPLVHIEAEDDFVSPSGATFYGRYSGGADNREPLGSSWGASYAGDIITKSDFVVWRDTTSGDVVPAGVDCGTLPSWGPLGQSEVICFNEEEENVEVCTGVDATNCFPKATQRRSTTELGIPYSFGWCFMNLNHDCTSCIPGGHGSQGIIAQSYVFSSYLAGGDFEVGLPSVELTHACDDIDPSLDPIFWNDDFETGDLTRWTLQRP